MSDQTHPLIPPAMKIARLCAPLSSGRIPQEILVLETSRENYWDIQHAKAMVGDFKTSPATKPGITDSVVDEWLGTLPPVPIWPDLCACEICCATD